MEMEWEWKWNVNGIEIEFVYHTKQNDFCHSALYDIQKLPTEKLPAEKLPAEKLPVEKLPVEKLKNGQNRGQNRRFLPPFEISAQYV